MEILTRFGVPGGVFLLTLASGLWLSRSGKPLNTGIFTVHKLIALAAVITSGTATYSGLKGAGIQAIVVTLLIPAAVGVLALFATGALMSMNRPAYGVLRTIHNVGPAVVIVAMALALHFLS